MASHLAENAKITIAATTTAGAAGQTAITSSAIDMAGFKGCLFIVPVGTVAATAVTSVKVQQCDTSGGSYADLEGTSITIADSDDNKLKYVDVRNPREQFLKCVVSRGTADATIGGIIAVQYDPRVKPVTHGANVAGEMHVYAPEGTP